MRIFIGSCTRRTLVLGLSVLWACSGGGDSSSAPTRADCEALRDRMVALRLESVTTDRAQHAANLTAALGSSFVDDCVANMTPSEVRCGRDAATGAALVTCSEP
jgi:hypothetical protein